MTKSIFLASSSPRRRQLLEDLGVRLRVDPAPIDESLRRGEPVGQAVRRLARAKAEAALGRTAPGEILLAADTLVSLDGSIFEKPKDARGARAMLRRLSGRTHEVYTGVALGAGGKLAIGRQRSLVTFRELAKRDIDWYVETQEPYDKAGAYALQGKGVFLIRAVRGSFTNVIGLPLELVHAMLGKMGFDLLDFMAPVDSVTRGSAATAGQRHV